jgi:hypothetical protein
MQLFRQQILIGANNDKGGKEAFMLQALAP